MACFLSLYPLLFTFINIIYNWLLLKRHARYSFLFGSWPTCIILPLKDEHKGNERSSLAAGFHDVHPSLLLFLHRLKGIFIYDEVGHTVRSRELKYSEKSDMVRRRPISDYKGKAVTSARTPEEMFLLRVFASSGHSWLVKVSHARDVVAHTVNSTSLYFPLRRYFIEDTLDCFPRCILVVFYGKILKTWGPVI